LEKFWLRTDLALLAAFHAAMIAGAAACAVAAFSAFSLVRPHQASA
jgi:hypothetical protein